MKKIGLTQRVENSSHYGERRDCLDQNWCRFLIGLDFFPIPLCNQVDDVNDYVKSLGIEGAILTGGNDLAQLEDASNKALERDRFEHALLETCQELGFPVLGICRGMQLINVHFGGTVIPIQGHTRNRHKVHLASHSPPSFHVQSEVNSFHDYSIRMEHLGKPLEPLVLAEDGTVEALRHPHLGWFGLMWHPERETPFSNQDKKTVRSIFPESGI